MAGTKTDKLWCSKSGIFVCWKRWIPCGSLTGSRPMLSPAFGSTTRANVRLLALTRAGFLKRAFVGSRQAVYWLPNKPLQDAFVRAKCRKQNRQHCSCGINWKSTDVRLMVQYSGIPARGWWFGKWQSFQKPLSATVPLIPDGYFEIGSQQGFRPAFVEVDLGTEAVPIIAKKANQYLQLAASGEFAQIFGRSQFRVLVITTSAQTRGKSRVPQSRSSLTKSSGSALWI